MDSVMPQGFFGNTQEIYAEVASYPVLPPEKIKQYWHVYTTTFRRLFDPSAFRLENFWWHVWGSERLRNLSGPALAKLFEEFTNGPTFVPLPSPAGRLMFARASASRRREADSHSAEEAAPPQNDDSEPGPSPSGSKKGPTPSAERPQPAHSILKKTRGPSTSGPRPTARFASPPASYEEVICAGEDAPTSKSATASEMPPPPLPSSARSKQAATPAASASGADTPPPPSMKPTLSNPLPAVSETEMQPPPPVSPVKADKAPTNTGRRIVVANASKRRPTIPRRLSSQSSTGSETGQRAATGSATASKRSGSKRTTPSGSQQSVQGSSSSQASEAGISAKASGKRPVKGKRSSSRNIPAQDKAPGSASGMGGQSQGSGSDTKDIQYPQETAQARAPAPAPPPVAGFVADQPTRRGPPAMIRSRSNNGEGPPGHREPGVALLPSQATSSVATFITTAQGHFDSETVTAEPVVPEARDIPDQVMYGSQPSSSVLDLQFRPTPPNPAPPIPFGRSKSELTLLLARGQPPPE